jgi:hypothetical protein
MVGFAIEVPRYSLTRYLPQEVTGFFVEQIENRGCSWLHFFRQGRFYRDKTAEIGRHLPQQGDKAPVWGRWAKCHTL